MLDQLAVILFLIAGVTSTPLTNDHSLVNVWEKSGQFEGDIKISDDKNDGGGSRYRRNVYTAGAWPDGIVPYYLSSFWFDESEENVIRAAMDTLENVIPSHLRNTDGSCQLKFVPHTSEHSDYIYFTPFDYEEVGGCWSPIGRQGGPQFLNLPQGCVTEYTILHELLHALGFHHMQSDPNRDKYVDIIWDNIKEGLKVQFNFSTEQVTDFGLGYDYYSIMHYPANDFAKNDSAGRPVGPTIKSKDPRVKLERNKKLSEKDKAKLLHLYCPRGVGDHTTSTTTKLNSTYPVDVKKLIKMKWDDMQFNLLKFFKSEKFEYDDETMTFDDDDEFCEKYIMYVERMVNDTLEKDIQRILSQTYSSDPQKVQDLTKLELLIVLLDMAKEIEMDLEEQFFKNRTCL